MLFLLVLESFFYFVQGHILNKKYKAQFFLNYNNKIFFVAQNVFTRRAGT